MPVTSPARRQKRALADAALEDHSRIEALFAALASTKPDVRYPSSGALRLVSEAAPQVLNPMLDRFAALLEQPNQILRWDAIFVIANLARVDEARRIDPLLERFFAPIGGPVLVTAANLIACAATIARAKPYLADWIAGQILSVSQARYATPECRNIALGRAVRTLDAIYDLVSDRQRVVEFVRKHARNPRPSTRKTAAAFLTKTRPTALT